MPSGSSSQQVKTIPQFLADAPDTDSMAIWSECWSILESLRERVADILPTTPHPSSEPYREWTSGSFEGSLNTYSGTEADWVVHSWIGNRSQGILDMNFQVWLGPHIDVPHLVIVFGTIPKIFHYSDLIPRRELATDIDHLQKYYDAVNEDFLRFRGDDRFVWSVSHGTYMRSIISPVGHSYTAERTEDVVTALRGYVEERFETWLGWVRDASPVPEHERPALAARDRFLREHIYRLDPMNALAEKFLEPGMAERLIEARFGQEQIHGSAPLGPDDRVGS